MGQFGSKLCLQRITQRRNAPMVSIAIGLTNFKGLGHADNAGYIKRARTHAALVSATIKHRFDAYPRVATAHIQKANSLWTVHFVCRARQQIDIHFLYINQLFANRLSGIGMKQHAILMANIANSLHRVNGAYFVISHH